MNDYDFSRIEKKWQDYWESNRTFKSTEQPDKPKYYILDMFPYPSGAGLHVGHPEGYTATDIISRYRRMRGFNVMHPMGWDAFGLPAEQYAIQNKTHPGITTNQNIDTFRRQIKALGFSYDWDREISTIDPGFYKWTQWIFLNIYNSWYDNRKDCARPIAELEAELETGGTNALNLEGIEPVTPEAWKQKNALEKSRFLDQFRLAYISDAPVNWCVELKAVLANEEVAEQQEKGYTVIKKPLRQWVLRITAFSERLLNDLDDLEWSESLKEMQRNWIGKSIGANIDFAVPETGEKIRVYTTRQDTIFGATFLVLSPEHPIVDRVTTDAQKKAVADYRQEAAMKTDLERTELSKDKSGVFTGGFATNPVTGQPVPIWIADYVLLGYGTGAIMGVPANDQRDYDFAVRYGLEIVEIIEGGEPVKGTTVQRIGGKLVNSSRSDGSLSIDGLEVEAAKKKVNAFLSKNGLGSEAVNYKIRDWLFSRQRYWGEPFPILHLEDGTCKALNDEDLPVVLPEVEFYEPSGTGESPLASITDWLNLADQESGQKAKRETNTMPQWAGSCWYYLRYLDPKNEKVFVDPVKEKYWMPVDLYIGGVEHAVLHLLYARFWHKLLYDLGHVSTKEPFAKLVNQGMILGEDGRKMSKSFGNVVNPDVVIKEYGADSIRLYEMFLGPLEQVKPWNTKGIEGVFRFLSRVWRMYVTEEGTLNPKIQDVPAPLSLQRVLHKTIKKVGQDIDEIRFNTAIAQMMIFVNELYKSEIRPRSILEPFILVLAPFAPHIAEEIWQKLGHKNTLAYEPFPDYDEALTIDDEVEVVFQVNGKIRDKCLVQKGTAKDALEKLALDSEKVRQHFNGKKVVKVIVVPDKLVNVVVK